MSRSAEVSLAWADGEHRFRLAIGQLRELQEKCDAGPAWILYRLQSRQWRVDDIRETLRLGLIGGGMSPMDALGLVARYVDERPLQENVAPAMAVLMAALVGVPEEPVGKPEAAETEAGSRPSSAAASASPRSTEPAPSSASPRQKSTA